MTEIYSNRPERIFPDDELHRPEGELRLKDDSELILNQDPLQSRKKPLEQVEWWEDEYHEGLGIRGSGRGRERYLPPQTGCQMV